MSDQDETGTPDAPPEADRPPSVDRPEGDATPESGALAGDVEILEVEVERLRRENEELSSAATSAGGSRPTSRVVIGFLLVLTTLFSAAAIPAVWLERTVTNTDRFVSAVAPLADDPTIQTALAERASERILSGIKAEDRIREALPDNLQILVGPLTGGVEWAVQRQAQAVVESDAFSDLWRETARISHAGVLGAITGREGTLSVEKGVVSLDLTPIISTVEERLAETPLAGLELSRPTGGVPDKLIIAESKALARASWAVDLLRRMALWPALLAIITGVAAVAASADRRRGVLRVGVVLIIAGLLPVLGINLGRVIAVEPLLGPMAADPKVPIHAYDIFTSGLVTSGRLVAALGALLVVGMYLLGPSARTTSLRTSVSEKVATTGGDYGPWGYWVVDHRSTLRIIGIVIALVFLLSAAQLTVTGIILIAAFLAAWLIVLQLPQRATAEMAAEPVPTPPPDDRPRG